jgi:uroporphyrin-III C-methyltransferase
MKGEFTPSPEDSPIRAMKGKVYLVGAGPGDPELLTLRAWRLLGEADVVLHDDLVNPEILHFAPPLAHIQNVGKRCGRPSVSQEEIHSRMAAYAKQGLLVVRLQGGDPLLFGRAGEEIEFLRKEGIEFEVVPGVTAAFGAAAMANVSLTDRRRASSVLFLSNHRRAGSEAPLERNHISENTTVVVYMPGTDYGELAAKLCAAGFDPRTPCLVVSCATWERQQVHSSTLESLPKGPGLPAPALLIVGRVAESYSSEQICAQDSDTSPTRSVLK